MVDRKPTTLTPEQVNELQVAVTYVINQTGYGNVTIEIRNGHPRLLAYTVKQELPAPPKHGPPIKEEQESV